ncbi:MAG TPA: DUF5666 domain-containing protein [Chloroflexia bacterium]|nr:DUF5666 domain-containing protein [Chloroflexia bacterium]
MTARIKLTLALSLMLITAFAAGLIISGMVSSANASTGSSTTASVVSSNANAALADNSAGLQANAENNDGLLQAALDDNTLNDAPVAAAPGAPGARGFGPGMGGPLAADSTEVQGAITKLENNNARITLGNNRVVNVNNSTTLGDANGTINASDLKVGDRVMALGKVETDKSLTARWLLKLAALPSLLNGQITSIDAANNTLKVKGGKENVEWTVTVSSTTTIKRNGSDAKLSDFKVNDNVSAVGKADTTAHTLAATALSNRPAPGNRPNPGNFVRGTVKSVDAANNNFVVTENVNGTSTDQKVVVNGSTHYAGTNLKALTDLKAGDTVSVMGQKQSDGSVLATSVASGQFERGKGGFPGGPRGRGMPGPNGQNGQGGTPTATPNSNQGNI